jgi:hypothetical protein
MKVITLWQPWASFIALGWKTIETRTHDRFKNLVGETIAIHAGNKWDENWIKFAAQYLTADEIINTKIHIKLMFEEGYYKGAIVCTTYVYHSQWLMNPHCADALIECDTKRYGLFLKDTKLIQPAIPAKGKQGIWNYEFKEGELIYL